jgi:phosphonoacetaldehyde hydrolase
MTIKAVVLDWAGTVIDFGSRAPMLALSDVFAATGVAVDEAAIRRYMGMAKREHVTAMLSEPDLSGRWRDAHSGTGWTETDIDRLMVALEPAMSEAAAKCADVIPGIVPAVGQLREQGIRIGSTTGYTRSMMAGILTSAAAQGYAPDVVVCAGETAQGRPAPLMIWKALVELGVWPAGAVVAVDDAPVGLAAGRNAGCWTVGVAASGNGLGLDFDAFTKLSPETRKARLERVADELAQAGADFVVETVVDLPRVIAEIDRLTASGRRPGEAVARIWVG